MSELIDNRQHRIRTADQQAVVVARHLPCRQFLCQSLSGEGFAAHIQGDDPVAVGWMAVAVRYQQAGTLLHREVDRPLGVQVVTSAWSARA